MKGSPPTRRTFFEQVGVAASMIGAGACSWTTGSREKHRARPVLGFLRQTDAASLLFAEELGYYAKQGLAPTFHRAASPIELKDRLVTGELVAAQLPASLPIALAGAGTPPSSSDLVTLMILSQNGSAVTLARDLCEAVKFLDLEALRKAIARRASTAPLVFAVPVTGGCDDLLLRYLLAAAEVAPAHFQIEVVPADRMIAELREERIVGFAAPDPWSALAAQQDVGFTFATAQDIWQTAPRSALVTTGKALADHRADLKAIVRALIETSVWLDVPANRARPTIGDVLARHQNLDLDSGPIRSRLANVYDLGCKLGERDFEDDMIFFHHGGRVNAPRRADALLYLALLGRFGLLPGPVYPAIVDRAIHGDLYKEVAREMGVSIPDDMKPFVITLDAVRFDPNTPAEWPRLWARA
ncbi:MAG TPA: ABC transporter substrate-binding protein [Polyangia bacterium]